MKRVIKKPQTAMRPPVQFQNTVFAAGDYLFKNMTVFQGSADTLMGGKNMESWSKVLQYKAKL